MGQEKSDEEIKEEKPKHFKSDKSESSECTDEEFDWYEHDVHDEETYFVFVNHERRTLQPGDEAFYCYGNRTNKFLLLNYGFAFADNKVDSLQFGVKMDQEVQANPFVPEMVAFHRGMELTQNIRLKTDQLNTNLITYLRYALKDDFFKKNPSMKKNIWITRPTNLFFERYCLSYYSDIIDYMLETHWEKKTKLEDD